MNEFTAKKLAEIEAFLQVSGVIIEKAGSPLAEANPEVAEGFDALSQQTIAEAVAPEVEDVFKNKVEKTHAKLSHMMEIYIGDEWDNPVEVLEWSSFFSGAAAAHAALASELSADTHDQLDTIRADFEALLQKVIAGLRAVGTARRDESDA